MIIDPRWKHPFPALIAGPTCRGKSQFVKRLQEAGEDMIDGAWENIIWCYGRYQSAYDEMLRTIPNITFVEGAPGDLETLINSSIRNLLVVDDLMHELSNDQRMTNLFTKGCHHRNLSVISILQNIFHRGKEVRDMSVNSHYLVVFKSPRDHGSQVNHLARQMLPGHVKYMQEAFEDATKRPYGYLFCDLKPAAYEYFPWEDSDKYKKREPHHISSVEDGTATAKNDALVRTIWECVLNVLKGTVPVSKPAKIKLLPHKKSLIALAEKSTPLDKEKKLLVQHGGNFLSFLLPPVLRVLSSILTYMNHTKRMVLVPENTLERLQQVERCCIINRVFVQRQLWLRHGSLM